jgi:hypothetical protein
VYRQVAVYGGSLAGINRLSGNSTRMLSHLVESNSPTQRSRKAGHCALPRLAFPCSGVIILSVFTLHTLCINALFRSPCPSNLRQHPLSSSSPPCYGNGVMLSRLFRQNTPPGRVRRSGIKSAAPSLLFVDLSRSIQLTSVDARLLAGYACINGFTKSWRRGSRCHTRETLS